MEIERIGPYVIDHKIGSGGMGTVYLAQHAETGRDVAVKVLPPALAREEGFVARFEREIESLQKLINPQIVRLLDSGVENSTYYYAMEYVEGETLTDRLRREKRLPWRDVVHLSLQICSALKSAHDAGIVHRDLKPSNLLIDKDNNIKLTDFGVAQVFAAGRLTMPGGIIGTAEYMSPEQAHGRRATKKSDLYSLGAVMYTMLTGRPPFVEKTTLEVIQKHKYGTFDRPSRYVEGIPRRLEETVCQLLDKDPDKRFPDALVLSRRLDEILRRADIASQEETRIADANSTGNGQSTSVYVDDETIDPADGVGGTLVRDLVKADIEKAAAGSPIHRAFNNTWVLLGLFVLLIGGGVAWFRLVDRSGDSGNSAVGRKTELEQLRLAKFALEKYLRNQSLDPTDPIVRRAIYALEVGDANRAERLLLSVEDFFTSQDQPHKWNDDLESALTSIRKIQETRHAIDVPKRMAEHLLGQAEALRKDDKLAEARELWLLVLDIYGDNPKFQKQVEKARQFLESSSRLPASETNTTVAPERIEESNEPPS